MSEAELSEQLYRWRGDDGGWQIGRIVEGCRRPAIAECADNQQPIWVSEELMRCEHGRLWWVRGRIEEHDTTYREQEKEAERAN